MEKRPHPTVSRSSESTPNPVHQLSCSNCRQRKVKCDRVHPCVHCVRSGIECVFPSRKRNRTPRRSQQGELLSRLSRLEAIVGKVDPGALATIKSSGGAKKNPLLVSGSVSPVTTDNVIRASASPSEAEKEKPLDSPAKDGPNKYFVSEFWTSLCSEINGIREALSQPSDSEDDDEHQESTPRSMDSSEGTPVLTSRLGLSSREVDVAVHPPPQQIQYLVETYFSNVDMLLKILHEPTIKSAVRAFVISGTRHMESPEMEAVVFAMYFAVLSSLSERSCLADLGEEKRTLVDRYTRAVEAALAKADYLNNTSLETLQALTIYAACVRCHDLGRTSWSLLGLVIRLAHGIDLHRDGDGSRFTPFEGEMRRRLWWQIIVLEVRNAEDRGTDALIAHDTYNNKMITNINDADFGPDTTEPLTDSKGPTDVTFSLATATSSNIFMKLYNPQVRFPPGADAPVNTYMPTEEEVLANANRLEAAFVTNADPTHFTSTLASRTVRLIIFKLWLTVQYPLRPYSGSQPSPNRPAVSPESILRTAVSVMDLHRSVHAMPGAERYEWWTRMYVQWHPLAVALAELCRQTRGPLVERAWAIVDDVFARWGDGVADTRRGKLWRPIKKLQRKAKAARADALMKDLQLQDKVGTGGEQPTSQGSASHDHTQAGEGIQAKNAGVDMASMSLANPFSMSNFEFQSSDLNFDFDDGLAGGEVELMDWTNWNEFVSDAYANDGENPTVSFPDLS